MVSDVVGKAKNGKYVCRTEKRYKSKPIGELSTSTVRRRMSPPSASPPSVTVMDGILTVTDGDSHVVETRQLGRKGPPAPARRQSSRFKEFSQTFGSL